MGDSRPWSATRPTASGWASPCAGGCRARCWSPASGWPASSRSPAGRLDGRRRSRWRCSSRVCCRYGSARLEVADGGFRAGRARIEAGTSAPPRPSTPSATRRVAGPRGRRPRVPAAAALPEARGPGGDHRPGRPGAVLAGELAPPRRAGRAPCNRPRPARTGLTRWVLSGHGIGQLQDLDRLLAGQRPRRRDGRAQGAEHLVEGRDRQEPAGEPGRPRRRHPRGRRLGHRQRRRRRGRPDARPAQGRVVLRALDRPPAARAASRTAPTAERPRPDGSEPA